MITVNDTIKLDEFNGSKVVAGYKGLANIVNNITIMEVPDIFSYVCSNNLIVTTLYPICDNEEAINSLIPKLANLKLAGICIKPDRYIAEIPQTIIEQGNRLDFPIIELPQNANLSFLVNGFLKLSLHKHVDTLNFRNHIHDSLMKLFLTGADVNSLVNSLSKIVKKPIILLDNYMELIYQSDELLDSVILISKADDREKSITITINDVAHHEDYFITHEIKADKTRFGYLLLLNSNKLDANLSVAIEQGSLLIASAFYKNYAVLEKERSFQDSFIRDILNGKITSQMDIINKARSFGWMLEFPQIIIVIKVIEGDIKERLKIYESMIEFRLKSVFINKLSISTNKFKIVYIDDSLVIFINSIFINDDKSKSIEIGNLIAEEFKDKITIGISNIITSVQELSKAYNEANMSCELGHVLNNTIYVSHFDDYQIFNIINQVGDKEILERFVKNKIGRIIKFDKDNGTKYIDTINVLINENMNLKKAAKKLFIHYNTLRYRIEKLEEIGIDFNENVRLSDLSLALTIHFWIEAFK